MCVAVLHNVIIGAERTAFGKLNIDSAYNATLCNTAWGSFKERRTGFIMKTEFDAATGSWRKSAAEFTERTYGFLLQRENSLLEQSAMMVS